MALTTEQLRTALGELSGQRGDVLIEFIGAEACRVRNAMLLPAESDNVLKLTDGAREYLVDVIARLEQGWPARRLTELLPHRWSPDLSL